MTAGVMVLDSRQEQPVAAFAELFNSGALPPLMQVTHTTESTASMVGRWDSRWDRRRQSPTARMCHRPRREAPCLSPRLPVRCHDGRGSAMMKLMCRSQEGAMEARVLKHYLLLHDAAEEGEDGTDRCGVDPVTRILIWPLGCLCIPHAVQVC